MTRLFTTPLLIAALASLAPVANAQDLFSVQAQGTGIQNSGDSLPDLLEEAISLQDSFISLVGQDVIFSVDYADITGAITIGLAATGQTAVLTIPGTGFTKTFTGSDPFDLQQQIEDYLQDEGGKEWSKFIQDTGFKTAVALIDGNPNSQTGHMMSGAFTRWGLGSAQAGLAPVSGRDDSSGLYVAVRAHGHRWEIQDQYDSDDYNLDLTLGTRLIPRVGLFGTLSAGTQTIGDAEIYRLGGEVALPITLDQSSLDGIQCTIEFTPLLTVNSVGSEDMAAGGAFYSYGGDLSATWRSGPLAFGLGVQHITHDGIDIPYKDYKFETLIDQRSLSYGTRLGYMLTSGVELYGQATRHTYKDRAAIDKWEEVQVGFHLGSHRFNFDIAYNGIFHSDIKGHGATAQLSFHF